MKKILLTVSFFLMISINMLAQSAETLANTYSLSITSDMSLLQNKSIQIEGRPFLKLLPASTGNVMLGIGTGLVNKNGRLNTYVGYQAGGNAVADSNTFVGHQAGFHTTTGRSNTFFGTNAGWNNVGGSRNTFVGRNAGLLANNGNDNVYLGYNAGQHDRGNSNTFLGQSADVLITNENTLYNATAIGANASVSASNSIILGNQVNVGIGTTAPKTKLEIVSEQVDESGLRLSHLTNTSKRVSEASRFLTVNDKGDVELAQYRLQINNTNEWSDKVFSSTYQLKPLSEVYQFINRHQHLPGLPSAKEVVEQGIDVVVLNAKLLEKIEELTLYIINLEKRLNQYQNQINEIQSSKPH